MQLTVQHVEAFLKNHVPESLQVSSPVETGKGLLFRLVTDLIACDAPLWCRIDLKGNITRVGVAEVAQACFAALDAGRAVLLNPFNNHQPQILEKGTLAEWLDERFVEYVPYVRPPLDLSKDMCEKILAGEHKNLWYRLPDQPDPEEEGAVRHINVHFCDHHDLWEAQWFTENGRRSCPLPLGVEQTFRIGKKRFQVTYLGAPYNVEGIGWVVPFSVTPTTTKEVVDVNA